MSHTLTPRERRKALANRRSLRLSHSLSADLSLSLSCREGKMSAESQKPSGLALVKNECPDCDYVAHFPSELSKHRRVHSDERPFTCPLCEATFTRKDSRDRHIKRVHLEADQVTCTWSGCDKTFSSAEHLRLHVAAIHLKTRFTCPVAGCKYTSGWKTNINHHIKASHRQSKSFTCSFAGCSFQTACQSYLSTHQQRVHEGKRIACPHDGCDFQTSWSEDLKRHTQSAHEKKAPATCVARGPPERMT